jgi:hypothetical protein
MKNEQDTPEQQQAQHLDIFVNTTVKVRTILMYYFTFKFIEKEEITQKIIPYTEI